MTLTLRPYQVDLIERCWQAFVAGRRRVLAVSPTGSGKSLTAAYMARGAVDRGHRVLLAAGRIELVDQNVRAMQQAGLADIRVVQAKRDSGSPDAPVIVGSIDTLIARDIPQVQFGILDEAHHGNAVTWSSLVNAQTDARWVGLTATPIRSDSKPMGDVFDALVVGPSVAALTAERHLVPCRVWAGPASLRSGQLALTPLEAYQRFAAGQRAAIFCRDVKHATSELAEFQAAGIPSAVITGSMPAGQRAAALEAWREGEILAVTSVGVLTEGFDLPVLSTAILACRVNHIGRYLQIAGRILRPFPGKSEALLVDLSGCAHEHGPPDFEHEYSLDGKPISTVAKDTVRQCPECGSVFMVGPQACPFCSAELPARIRELPKSIGVGVSELTTRTRPEFVVGIVSKYRGTCVDCGQPYARGDKILWATVARKAKHRSCPKRAAA